MNPGRVLIVDDNLTNLKLAQYALEREGHHVRTAGDAGETLSVLETFLPDVILMDLQLPGRSGFELTRSLRQRPEMAGVRILALTAYAMRGDEERAYTAGCDGYLAKPVLPDALRAEVARQLRARRQVKT